MWFEFIIGSKSFNRIISENVFDLFDGLFFYQKYIIRVTIFRKTILWDQKYFVH